MLKRKRVGSVNLESEKFLNIPVIALVDGVVSCKSICFYDFEE